MDENWSVYLIECSDGSYYTGITNNVEKRYKAHCDGKGAKYTRAKRPLKLLWHKLVGTKGQALKAEHAVRQLKKQDKLKYGMAAAAA